MWFGIRELSLRGSGRNCRSSTRRLDSRLESAQTGCAQEQAWIEGCEATAHLTPGYRQLALGRRPHRYRLYECLQHKNNVLLRRWRAIAAAGRRPMPSDFASPLFRHDSTGSTLSRGLHQNFSKPMSFMAPFSDLGSTPQDPIWTHDGS